MKKAILFLLLANSIFQGRAGVNYKNGNFYISYTDIGYEGAKMDITRSYSSKSSATGLFGFGWSTLLETRLVLLPDGTVCVRWWGDGSKEVMEGVVSNKKGLYEMVNAVVQIEIREKKIKNIPVDILKLKAEMLANQQTLLNKYLSYVDRGWIKPKSITGTEKAMWKIDENRILNWNGQEYELHSWADVYKFNRDGLLTEIRQDGGMLQLKYKQQCLTKALIDSKYSCTFETDSAGKITRITTLDSGKVKTALFTYDDNNNLLYSKDMEGNEYWYSYDAAHNMVQIRYSDSTRVMIEYDPATYFAVKVTERNGKSKTYQYISFYNQYGEPSDMHYATRVKDFDSLGRQTLSSYYEYEYRSRSDDSWYLHRYLAVSDTSYEEDLYDKIAENAAYRKKNNKEAWAQYDAKTRCTYLRINDSVYRVQYNINDKPDAYFIIDSVKKDTIVYRYSYDQQGELTQVVKNGEAYSVKKTGTPQQLQVTNGDTTLFLRYDEEKLVHATSPALGSVDIGKEAAGSEKKQLLELAKSYAEIIKPKKIAHEWIWERM